MARRKNKTELNNLLEKVVTKISSDFSCLDDLGLD